MNPRVEIERQRMRDELRASRAKSQTVTVLGVYDNVTGLNQAISQDGGISFGKNLSNLAQLGDPMRLTKAGGQTAAIDSLQAPRGNPNQKDGYSGGAFSVNNGDILGDPTASSLGIGENFSALRGDIFGGWGVYRKRNQASINQAPINQEPIIDPPITDIDVLVGEPPLTINLFSNFSDPDNDDTELTYEIISNTNPGVVSLSDIDPATGDLTLFFFNEGFSRVTVKVTDPLGEFVIDEFLVTVSSPIALDMVAEGNAFYNSATDSYFLTTTGSPPTQVGGIASLTTIAAPFFRFDFEFRIYGNSTALFADGLAFSYTPSPLGLAGGDLGLGDLGLGFACGVKTYFGDNVSAQNQVRAFGRGGGGFVQSANQLRLRSADWQSASILVFPDLVDFSFGGVLLSLATPSLPAGYFLRISAATATHNDNHEIRNLRFNGKPINFIPPTP